MKTPHATHRIELQGAGVASAAGGLSPSVAAFAMGAAPLGSQLLPDERDFAGDPICAVPACAAPLPAAARVQAMVRAAVEDLCANTGLNRAAIAAERLFLVTPESAAVQPELVPAALQAWLDGCGATVAAAQRALMQRVSTHDDPANALASARAYLAGHGQHALVLCAETWLGHRALQALDADDQLRSATSSGVVPGEAAVLLRLAGQGATALHYAGADELDARRQTERPLGSIASELIVAMSGMPTFGDARFATLLLDRHASHRALAREEDFVRQRNAAHLRPADAQAWLNSGVLGYLGRCAPLLHLAALAQLGPARLPALACARSLGQATWVCARAAVDVPRSIEASHAIVH